MLGAAFAAKAPAIPSWETGFKNGSDIGGLLSAVLSPTKGFGKFLVVLIALSIPSACAPTMYTFGKDLLLFSYPEQVFDGWCIVVGNSLMAVAPIFARVPRYIYSIVSTAMSVYFSCCFPFPALY